MILKFRYQPGIWLTHQFWILLFLPFSSCHNLSFHFSVILALISVYWHLQWIKMKFSLLIVLTALGVGESTQAREPETYNSPPLSCSTLKNKLSGNYFSFDSLIFIFLKFICGRSLTINVTRSSPGINFYAKNFF